VHQTGEISAVFVMLLIFTVHPCAACTLKPLVCLFTLAAEIGSSVRVGCLTDGVNGQTTFAHIR
jgi:hypothetical protein